MSRFYRTLLHLYPASFRAEYGDELATTFAARMVGGNAAATVIAAIADVVPNAIAAHWDILRADLRQTVRMLRRSPGFALTAVLVVALGVGANTAAFSVADFVLIRPLPFPEPERLVRVWEATPGYQMELSPGNYKDWKADAKSFSSMGAYVNMALNLTGSGEPRRVETSHVTWDLFATLGVRPLLGRTFVASDTVAHDVIVISRDLWQTQFGGSPTILGTRVDLDGAPYTVIGVMPDDFHFPTRTIAVWKTMQFTANDLAARNDNYIDVVARLKPGMTIDNARAELSLIAARLERAFPVDNKDTGAAVERMSDQLSARARLLLLALCGASLCILLLACANLANLLLARAASRERELAVRAALGAGRERLVRQIITESSVLAVLGGTVGVVVAMAAVPALTRLIPTSLPIAQQPSVDLRVLGFAGALVFVTCLLFSVLPAFRAAGARTLDGLREGTRSGGARQRTRSLLVVIEVAASVVLLISSGLLVRAMWRIQSVDPGFRTENIITLRTALPFAKYRNIEVRQRFYDKVLGDLRALPGVTNAAYISYLPMTMRGGIWPVVLPGRDEATRTAENSASLRYTTPQLFSALGIPVKQGREIDETDDNARPNVAVVSESFAKRYWPNETPIGKHFRFAFRDRMIVGIAGDVRVRGLEQVSEPQVYIPYRQSDSLLLGYLPKDLVIRSATPMATLMPAVRRIVREADPLQPISDVRTMEEIVANETASRLAQLRVLMILAAVALVLSAVGIHGLLSFTVSRRSREIGVRMALGAQSAQVRRMILSEGILLALAGIIPGVLIAYAAGRGMEALLAGVQPGDTMTFLTAVVLCALTTVLGCLRPAFRASRVDPISAMRAE